MSGFDDFDNVFADLGLAFFERFDIFLSFFFQFFENDLMKWAWVTQDMTWMILRMTQMTSIMAKMTLKRMRYRPTDGPTDGPTEWHIESLHATKNTMSGNEAGVLREHFTTFYHVSWAWSRLFGAFWHFLIFLIFPIFWVRLDEMSLRDSRYDLNDP